MKLHEIVLSWMRDCKNLGIEVTVSSLRHHAQYHFDTKMRKGSAVVRYYRNNKMALDAEDADAIQKLIEFCETIET